MKRIFLSYRRSDSADFTARLYERLARLVGRKNLFKDIDSIPGGRDFRAAIEVSVLQSDIMLVIIGPSWVMIGDQLGRRLDNPEDPVRNEIEMAMRHGKQILPILIDATPMPREDELPPRLHSLSYLQAHRIRTDGNFEADVRALMRQLMGSTINRTILGGVLALIAMMVISLVIVFKVLPSAGGLPGTASTETKPPTSAETASPTPISCPNALPTRLVNGMHGRVVPGEVNNRLRAAPSLDAVIVSQLPGGSEFDVIDDPTCGDGFTWVPIRIFGQIGYTAEGDANGYWIEPYSPEATAESTP